MCEQFQIIEVPDDAAHAPEAMGTKPKFWFDDPELGHCLFKEARPGTGEDWAEKIAAELAGLLGLPHARYELGTWRGKPGSVSPTFVPREGLLLHGNDLLMAVVPGYPTSGGGTKAFYHVQQHTIGLVLEIMGVDQFLLPLDWTAPDGIKTCVDVFVGYLLLDAWMGHQDRHHENWGFVHTGIGLHLAPTYDHGSSLGRNETDETRRRRLATKDAQYTVDAFVERAASAFYDSEGDKKPLTTLDAFERAARRSPKSARIWLDRLSGVPADQTRAALERIPSERISQVAVEFAQAMLEANRIRLLRLSEDLG